MVDLVKIRKKAKKGKDAGGAPTSSPAEEPSGAPAAPPAQRSKDAGEAAGAPPKIAGAPQKTSKLEKFKEEAGKLREQAAAVAEAQQAASGEQVELLTFVIAGEHYAVDIGRIVEIVTPRPITRVPNAHPSIVGIVSLRGTVVTLLDARGRLRHPAATGTDEDRRVIVIDQGGELVGFEVDRVLRVVKIDPGAVEAHPVVHASELEEAIRGVFRHENALTILLDLDKLLAGEALPQSAA